MARQPDEQLVAQVTTLHHTVNELIAGRSIEPEMIDRTLYELLRVIGQVAVGGYPDDLIRGLWDDHKRLAQYRQIQRSTPPFLSYALYTPPPPARPVEIHDPLLLKLLARMNGQRVRLTPKQRREMARRREMRRRLAELEKPIVLAERPRALPTGDHPITQALAQLNTLK